MARRILLPSTVALLFGLAFLHLKDVCAFLPSGRSRYLPFRCTTHILRKNCVRSGNFAPIYASADESESGPATEKRELDRLFEEVEKANQSNGLKEAIKSTVSRLLLPSAGSKAVRTEPDRPFRFPAYGFLVMSMLLGISFTGSLTELAGGKPLLGQTATIAVIATAGPGFVASFVVAVKRYNEEKEEDNARLEEEERQDELARQRALQGPVPLEALKEKE